MFGLVCSTVFSCCEVRPGAERPLPVALASTVARDVRQIINGKAAASEKAVTRQAFLFISPPFIRGPRPPRLCNLLVTLVVSMRYRDILLRNICSVEETSRPVQLSAEPPFEVSFDL